jgi:hypothetical protein
VIRRSLVPRWVVTPRLALLLAALGLAGVAALTSLGPAPPRVETATPPSLAERLGPRTWAFGIPLSWLAAPIPGLRDGDVIDLVGTRTSERATASEIASGLRLMSADERALVVELTAEDAMAIAGARARGLTLIPILRSVR